MQLAELAIPMELLFMLLWVSTWAMAMIWIINGDGKKARAATRPDASGAARSRAAMGSSVTGPQR